MQEIFCIARFELLQSDFRAIVNRFRACPPLEGLSAVILVRHLCGGVADWRARPPSLWRAGLLTISCIPRRENSRFKNDPYP